MVTCWERADLLALVGDVYCIFVTFPCGMLGQVWYLIVSFLIFAVFLSLEKACKKNSKPLLAVCHLGKCVCFLSSTAFLFIFSRIPLECQTV